MPLDTSVPTMSRTMPLDHGPADEILSTVEAHWRDMRRGRVAPERTDIDPRALDLALPWSFVLQRTAPGATRLRVAGQKLHDLIKVDPRGMPLTTFFNPTSHEALSSWIDTAFQAPALVELDLTSPGGLARSPMRSRLLLLPLRNALGETYRLFGALVIDGQVGLRQRRFDIEASLPARIVHLDEDQVAPTQMRSAPALVQNALVPLESTSMPKRGHLRLVVNNS